MKYKENPSSFLTVFQIVKLRHSNKLLLKMSLLNDERLLVSVIRRGNDQNAECRSNVEQYLQSLVLTIRSSISRNGSD